MRDTSLVAFQQLKHLGDKQQSVLIAINNLPDCTDHEIAEYLQWTINRVCPRRNELEKLGCIKSSGYKIHQGRKCHTWACVKPNIKP